MKHRNGFVSNSSSSSFIAIGKTVTLDEINLKKQTIFIGEYLNEGKDIVEVTPSLLKRIKQAEKEEHKIKGWYKFFEVQMSVTSEESLKFPVDVSFKKGTEIFSCEKDYRCTESVDEFIEKYILEY